MESGRKHKSLL